MSGKPWTTWTPACSSARDHSMLRRSSKRAFSSTQADRLLARPRRSRSAPGRAALVARAVDGRLHRDHVRIVGRRLRRTPRSSSGTTRRAGGRAGRRGGSRRRSARALFDAREARLGDRHPGLVLQVGPVERDELHQVGEVEQALDLVDLVGRTPSPPQPLEHRRARRRPRPRPGRRRRSGAAGARSRRPRAGRRRRPTPRSRRRG